MQLYKLTLIAASILIMSAGKLYAAEVPAAAPIEPSEWASTAELGVVVTSGNTKTSTVSGKFDTTKEVEKWRHNFHAEALSSNSGEVSSAEKYLASAKTDYKFNEFDYMFGLIVLEKDLFSGFDNQKTVAAGYGRRILNDETMTLDLEIGPGVRFYKIEESIDPAARQEREAILRLAAKYTWKLSANAKFTENLVTEIGQDTSITKSVTGLQANINSRLAMKFTVTVKNTSRVPVGRKGTDTETALTLVYSF